MKQVIELKESQGLTSPKKVFDSIKKINIDYSQENFLVLFLNTKNNVIDSEVMFKGGLNSCIIDPKTIFRKALLKNSGSIIISHNHPSGDLKPSKEDIEIFEKLKKAGKLLSLTVLDSIVFNETSYYSML